MDHRLRKALILFLIVVFGTWLARHNGWYNTYWYTDVILHLVSGVMFSYLWSWLSRGTTYSSWWILGLSTIAFATLGSVVWEFWEYGGHLILPAQTNFYVPALGDTLGDIFCGLLGGALQWVLLTKFY